MRRAPALLALLALAVASVGVSVANLRLREVDAAGPDLSLRFSEDGGIVRVTDRDRVLPASGARGGFSIRPVGGAANLLPNPGFEQDADGDGLPDGWRLVGGDSGIEGGARLDESGPRSGERSWAVDLARTGTSAMLVTDVAVRPGVEYSLRSWIRTEDVAPEVAPADVAAARVQVVQRGVPGRRGAAAAFGYTGTSAWSRHDAGVRTAAGVEWVQVRLLIRGGSGRAWFDDLSLAPLLEPAVPVRGRVEDAHLFGPVFAGAIPGEGLELGAELGPHEGGLLVRGELRATDGLDHAAQVAFTLPLGLDGWRWGDDPRRSRRIESGTYANLSDPPPQGARRRSAGSTRSCARASTPSAASTTRTPRSGSGSRWPHRARSGSSPRPRA